MIARIVALAILVVALVLLERAFALRAQPILRPGWRTDVLHAILSRALAQAGLVITIGLVFGVLVGLEPHVVTMRAAIAAWPPIAQLALAVAVADLCAYAVHRAAHTVPWLWRFHRLHHSSEHMDWLASFRVHPVDVIVARTAQFAPLFLLGFSKETFGAYAAIAGIWALVLHANLPVSFGRLRLVAASTQFHHWHHAREIRGNYAGMLPVFDWLFGTLHLPRGQWPASYGVDDPSRVSEGWLAHVGAGPTQR